MSQTPAVRELRIAPVMTGGTSLAVWMGGVTAELYSLLRHSEAQNSEVGILYGKLLDVTRTRPVVDVITGTSAGGLNGCLLALAVCLDVPNSDFERIRDTWMDTADLKDLLRGSDERNPQSLLNGDGRFLAAMQKLLGDWTAGRDWEHGKTEDVDLVTTYTCVRPVPQGRVDDFDEDLNEVVYAGTLNFTEEHFKDRAILQKLAIAARTSSSIPGVFEPSFLPSNLEDAVKSGRPDFSPHQPPHARGSSRWAVDGGLVVNLPLSEALDRIFNRSADSQVRRVALYVCPTPSEGPLGNLDKRDTYESPPPIVKSLAAVVASPRAEGIAGDVDTIRQHGDAVVRQRAMRRSMGSFIGALNSDLLLPGSQGATSMFDVFRDRRTDASVGHLLGRLRLQRGRPDPTDSELRERLRQYRWNLMAPGIGSLGGGGRSWGWGIAPVEEAGSTALGLINRALDLAAYQRGLNETEVAKHAAWMSKLLAMKLEVHSQLTDVKKIRKLDEIYWVDVLSRPLPGGVDPYAQWPFAAPGGIDEALAEAKRAVVFRELLDAHTAIAAALLGAAPSIRAAAASVSDTTVQLAAAVAGPIASNTRGARAQGLLDELVLLVPTEEGTVEGVRSRLLMSHVVATLLLDDVVTREQPCELMQVSWNAPNTLDPGRSHDEKLVGPELARLGAFLKRSWRANDWFWGRMDGAARLTRLLLDPRRLHELQVTDTQLVDALELVDVGAELDFLRPGSTAPPPKSLPQTTEQLIRRVQLQIAREELPRIADAIELTTKVGGHEGDGGAFRNAVRAAFDDPQQPPTDAQIMALVAALKIGSETALTERKSKLMRDTMKHGSDVVLNALFGQSFGFSVPQFFRWPARTTLYFVRRAMRK